MYECPAAPPLPLKRLPVGCLLRRRARLSSVMATHGEIKLPDGSVNPMHNECESAHRKSGSTSKTNPINAGRKISPGRALGHDFLSTDRGELFNLEEEIVIETAPPDGAGPEEAVPSEATLPRSHVSGFDRTNGRSYFRCVRKGGLSRQSNGSEPFSPTTVYPDNFVITADGSEIGTILRKVGQGAMGTVYQMILVHGSTCAVKTVRSDVADEVRAEHEKLLAIEVTFGFAMGRSPFVMTVIRMVVALPDIPTTANGLLLLCDFVDGGDLEEAMSTKEAVRREQPDYKGKLWQELASVWPVASITLQIFKAFEHCHAHGVFHQVLPRPSLFR